jgi:DNA-binding transcriptional MocR family regulator
VDQAEALAQLVRELGDWAIGSAPLFRQLARAIASGIERGILGRGTRLPAERALAAALVVSRGTAVAAYDVLVADGLIERRQGSGTYVLGAGALGLPPGREGSALVHRLVELSAGPSTIIDLSISVLHDASGLPPVSLATRAGCRSGFACRHRPPNRSRKKRCARVWRWPPLRRSHRPRATRIVSASRSADRPSSSKKASDGWPRQCQEFLMLEVHRSS